MKQYNKLFAILFAVLGVTTLQAQTDVTSTYLTNADFEGEYSTFWTGSQRAIFQPEGWTVVRTNGNDNDMSILTSTDVANESFSSWTINDPTKRGNKTYWTRLRWGGQVWNWNGTTGKPTNLQLQQEIKQLPEGVYRLSADLLSYAHGTEANNHTYLIATNTTTKRSVSVEPTIYHEKNDNNWENKSILIPSSGTTKYTVTLQCLQNWQGTGEYISGFDNVKIEQITVSQENPVDLTAFVGTGNADWVGASGTYSNCVEHFVWGGTQTGEYLSQIVTDLPLGLYEVAMYCASSSTSSRDNGGTTPVEEGSTEYVTLSANNTSVDIPSYNRTSIEGDIQSYTLTDVKVTDGTLKLLVNINQPNPNWIVANIKSLKYLGPDLTIYKEALAEYLTKAENIDKNSIPAPMASQLESAISSAKNVTQTLEAIQQATEQLKNIIQVVEDSQEPYDNLKNLITQCNEYASESYSSVEDESTRTAFNEAITTASTNGNKATTVEELIEAFNALETARQDFVLVAIPTTDNSYDMTFMIKNPSFETGDLTGWTVTASSDTGVKPNSNGTYTTTGTDGNYLFNTYWKGNPLTQAISGLPSGVYELKVLVASDGATVYLTADDEHNEGTMTSDKGQFLESSITFVCTDGNVVIGVVGGANGEAAEHKDFVADGYWWYKADNFRLYRSFDPSTAQNNLQSLKTRANELLKQAMNKDVKTELSNKNNSADATSDNPFELASMATTLNEAIAKADASIAEYVKLRKYIDMTKVFTDVTAYETRYSNGEYTSNDVEPARQELNVMRFNAASAIYTNKVEVTGWTGTMGERSDQHWSGTAINYKDANSWDDIDDDALTTSIKLVKGNYVLKVAGRSHVDALLTLEVLGQTIEFHAKGDTGYGIDTKGNATFAADATYTNGDAGRGWEWEFLKFSLEEEQTVTLSVNSHYNKKWQVWNSFGDITLWMDDQTYVTVNGGAINAPLAEAKKLLNTLPMGNAENTALLNAINLCNTTATNPEELNAQIEALNTAVGNANTWRNTYYTEKNKLVAALERFEADYNDAENGPLGYLNMPTRWATVITEAGEAAVAKDNQTDHSVITTATNELLAALTAADVSIKEYKDLKAAIDNAAFAAANIGNEPFQRPESAAKGVTDNIDNAKTTYDGREADGTGVTDVTTALKGANDAFFATPLNAPKEGARYNLVLNNNGGYERDNLAVTYLANQRTDHGLYNIQYYTAVNANYAQAFTFTAVEGQQDCYKLSMTDVDGNERYISTGVPYGGNAGQIRTTTNADEALVVKVIATATDGVHNLMNTEANNYIGSQDEGVFTVNSHINFNLKEAAKAEVTLTISDAQWATLILPFDADVPDGVTAYASDKINPETEDVTLAEAETLKANTPYLINGEADTHTFSGYGLADKDSYTDEADLFVGTYVEYTTQADANNYVLQNHNGEVAFYLVTDAAQPKINPYRCYMTYENETGAAGAPVFRFIRGGDTTAIDSTELNGNAPVTIYDLMGRKVTSMEKGKMYIVNGKKVMVK